MLHLLPHAASSLLGGHSKPNTVVHVLGGGISEHRVPPPLLLLRLPQLRRGESKNFLPPCCVVRGVHGCMYDRVNSTSYSLVCVLEYTHKINLHARQSHMAGPTATQMVRSSGLMHRMSFSISRTDSRYNRYYRSRYPVLEGSGTWLLTRILLKI